jgi:hypothetical protein
LNKGSDRLARRKLSLIAADAIAKALVDVTIQRATIERALVSGDLLP